MAVDRINPSRREITPQRRQPGQMLPALEMLTRSTSRIGDAFAEADRTNTSLDLARENAEQRIKADENKVRDVDAQVRFLRMQGEHTRGYAQRARVIEPGAPGFAEQEAEIARKLTEDFMNSLGDNPDLQNKYRPLSEQFVQDTLTSATEHKVQSQFSQYALTGTELQSTFTDMILSPETSIRDFDDIEDEFEEQLETYLRNTILSEADTLALEQTLTESFQRSKLARLSQEEVMGNLFNEGSVDFSYEIQSDVDLTGVSRPAQSALGALEAATGMTFKVNSAHRDKEHNAAVGGAKNSQHVHGNAFDIDVSMHPRSVRLELIAAARAAGFGGIGVGTNILHVDTGEVRDWGYGPNGKPVSDPPSWALNTVRTSQRYNTPTGLVQDGADLRSDKPVAAGLPRAAVGLLSGIMSAQSNGTYNAPAGAYGLEDGLAPEEQDRAAWALAQETYSRKTNGGNLLSVLQGGNRSDIEQVRQYLSGQNDGQGVWEKLKDMSPDDFYNMVAKQTGNPSTLIFGEEFQNIPIQDRLEIYAQGQSRAQSLMNELEVERLELQSQAFNGLMTQISGPEGLSLQDIQSVADQQNMNADQRAELFAAWESENEAEISAGRFTQVLNDPNAPITPGSADTKSNIDNFLEVSGNMQRIQEADPDVIRDILAPITARTNTITGATAGILKQQAVSGDPTSMEFAYQSINALMAASPSGANAAFDQETRNNALLYRSLAGNMPKDALMELMKQSSDPATASVREARTAIFDKQVTAGDIEIDTPTVVRDLFGRKAGIDSLASSRFQDEYTAIYRQYYALTGDQSLSEEVAQEAIQMNWSMTQAGARDLVMRNAPETRLPPHKGSHDYVNEQLTAITVDETAFFVSDATTQRQVNAGESPSYPVMHTPEGTGGIPIPMTMKDTQLYKELVGTVGLNLDAHANAPVRLSPSVTDQMEAEVQREFIEANRTATLEADLRDTTLTRAERREARKELEDAGLRKPLPARRTMEGISSDGYDGPYKSSKPKMRTAFTQDLADWAGALGNSKNARDLTQKTQELLSDPDMTNEEALTAARTTYNMWENAFDTVPWADISFTAQARKNQQELLTILSRFALTNNLSLRDVTGGPERGANRTPEKWKPIDFPRKNRTLDLFQ